MSKRLLVLATAIDNKTSGAFVILSQVMQALGENTDSKEVVLLSPAELEIVDKTKFTQIKINHNRKWLKRFIFEFFFWITKYSKSADIILSLQNTMPVTFLRRTKKVIYLHQPLPFAEHLKINPFRKGQLADFVKKYFYLFSIRVGLRKDVIIVVQTEWMRQAAIAKLNHPAKNVLKMMPEYPFDSGKYPGKVQAPKGLNLFYPASFYFHKNHAKLLEAIQIVQKTDPSVKLFLTLNGQEGNLKLLAEKLNIHSNIVWLGALTKDEVFDWYQKCDALIFPSVLETLGLPLLEAAHFNLPIMVSALPYALEVLSGYQNVDFFDPQFPDLMARSILCLRGRSFSNKKFTSSGVKWSEFTRSVLG